MTNIADERLMKAVAGGDLCAFNELIRRYQSLAWKTAYRFLGDSMEAEDVAQEVFLNILVAASNYRATATFRTYFYSILTRKCIDRSRKKRPINVDHIPEVADPAQGPAEILIEKERKQQVQEALDVLPANQKAAMILKHYEGLSYTEISDILGVTPKAVEGLISRARASLKALFASPKEY